MSPSLVCALALIDSHVAKPYFLGYDIPDWPHLLFLYSRLKPGKTVLEWMEEYHVYQQGIDVRRFMTFGVIKVIHPYHFIL